MKLAGVEFPYVQYSEAYVHVEEDARTNQRGLWQGASIAPGDWRHKNNRTIILGAYSVPIDAQKLLLGISMSEDPQSRSEIDVSDALGAVEVATFEADELLNRVLIRTRLPTDRRIDAFQDAGALLHHTYHAMRFVRRAFERRHEWPDPSDEPLQMTNLAQLADALEDMEEAKSHLGLAFFIFEVAADPSHWSNIIEPKKYAAAFERVSTALEKVKLAIDSLTSQPPD